VDPSIVVDGGNRGEGAAAHGTPQYFVSVHHNVPASLKHRKLTMTYTPPATTSQAVAGGIRFGKVAFSADSKLLVAIADGEHVDEVRVRGHTPGNARTNTRDGGLSAGYFTMVVWEWQKDKMIASAHFQQNPKDRIDVSRVLFNPSDKNCITTSGQGCLRQWNLVTLGGEIVPRSLLPPNKCADNFVDHAWMRGKSVGTEPPDRRLVVVTDGSAPVTTANDRSAFSPQINSSVPHGLLKKQSTRSGFGDDPRHFQILVFAPDVDNPLNYELVKSFLAPLPTGGSNPCTVETIAPYGKGFIVAGGGGFVQLWDRTEHSDLYAKARTLVPQASKEITPQRNYSNSSPRSTSSSKAAEVMTWGTDAHFTTLNIHANDELMVAVTEKQELMTFALGSLEVMEEVDTLQAYSLFSEVAGSHERGTKVTCMSTCVCKPLLVTGGEDCTVRLWDYSNWRGRGDIVWESTPGDGAPNDVSIHPTGNCLLIAYDSRVRLMTVLLDSLKPFREVSYIYTQSRCMFCFAALWFALPPFFEVA
jgi:WD40 repeat protein